MIDHLIEINYVEYLEGYKLKLTFDNGKTKIVDLADELDGEVFEPLRRIDFFRQVKVDSEIGTICWPNKADFAPDTLYQLGIDADQSGVQPQYIENRF